MTFRLADIDGRPALVDGSDGWHAIDRVGGALAGHTVNDLLSRAEELHTLAGGLDPASADGRFTDALHAGRVGPPVPAPRSVFAIGLNYRSHAAESGAEPPPTPLVFTKFPSCLVGPRAPIALAAPTADHEVELVVVIGRGGRDIDPSDAWSHVVGLTVGQDISDRALQFAARPPHFDLGKSRDTYGPTGPMLVSTDAFDDPDDLELECLVNGIRHQHARTSDLIFDVPTLISYLSGILTLQPGDLLFTGTPDGVGAPAGRFLVPGDVVESTIEGIGTIVNHCIE